MTRNPLKYFVYASTGLLVLLFACDHELCKANPSPIVTTICLIAVGLYILRALWWLIHSFSDRHDSDSHKKVIEEIKNQTAIELKKYLGVL